MQDVCLVPPTLEGRSGEVAHVHSDTHTHTPTTPLILRVHAPKYAEHNHFSV